MQGRLRNEFVSVIVNSRCVHCDRDIEIKLDSDMNYEVADASPIVFSPLIDWHSFSAANIIPDF